MTLKFFLRKIFINSVRITCENFGMTDQFLDQNFQIKQPTKKFVSLKLKLLIKYSIKNSIDDTWSSDLDTEKCKEMHRNNLNTRFSSKMALGLCQTSIKSKLIIDSKNVQQSMLHYIAVSFCAVSVNRIHGKIAKSFTTLNIVTLRLLYTWLVSPYLGFAVSS
ncbi:hypothetical protein BpHYR1_024523 [Brachionus plicatilis]|uniref:Uncharacterized protein n=1 Tax=Brachionus plicatilis TaxID=10195 RepID=A0A3M7RAI9_BRAPC|nr:hypothetical protein BpHYR1_024523 [Brachionus plicatilis]